MRRRILFLSLVMVGPGMAEAAGINCTASERRLEIELDASTDPARGGAIYEAAGQISVKLPGHKRNLSILLDGNHVAQYWSDEDELRLRLARTVEEAGDPGAEAGGDVAEDEAAAIPANGPVDLTIVAHRDASTGEFEGTYRLVSSMIEAEATGSVVCVVETQ